MIALIWAQATGGVIGADGGIPWRLPEDLAMFRELTVGSTVLMGRATWDSLPPRFRPLPDRRNLVLSRSREWTADGASRVGSLGEAVGAALTDLWVIGGASVYELALPVADRLVVTEVDLDVPGDTFAPTIDASWQDASREPAAGWSRSSTGLGFSVTTYIRPT